MEHDSYSQDPSTTPLTDKVPPFHDTSVWQADLHSPTETTSTADDVHASPDEPCSALDDSPELDLPLAPPQDLDTNDTAAAESLHTIPQPEPLLNDPTPSPSASMHSQDGLAIAQPAGSSGDHDQYPKAMPWDIPITKISASNVGSSPLQAASCPLPAPTACTPDTTSPEVPASSKLTSPRDQQEDASMPASEEEDLDDPPAEDCGPQEDSDVESLRSHLTEEAVEHQDSLSDDDNGDIAEQDDNNEVAHGPVVRHSLGSDVMDDDDDDVPINQLLQAFLSDPTPQPASTLLCPSILTPPAAQPSSSTSTPTPSTLLPMARGSSSAMPSSLTIPAFDIGTGHLNRTSTMGSDERTLAELRPRHIWENDRQASECRRCNRRFNFLVRRHHCRRCGQIVCDRCSSHRIRLPVEELVEDPMISTAHYPIIAMNPQRICDSCIRIPIKASVEPGRRSGYVPPPYQDMGMRRSDSQQSLLTECPVCGTGLLGMQKLQQEQHLNQCLNTGSPTVRPPRYIVYTLEQEATQVGDECPICFEEFEAGDRIARMVCLCSYHKRCLREWLERGKGCPVHFDSNFGS